MKQVDSFTFDAIQGFKFGSWPFGKPSMYVHTYFIDGLLIDTGHSNMRKEIISTLSQLPVNQIFVTHHHEDHTGNLVPLQDHFACPAYASSRCVELMEHPPVISFAQWLTWGKTDPNVDLIAEDRFLSTEYFHFELIPIPGHAVDMVGLYEANQGWFFSADLYVYDYIRYFMRSESMAQQIQSIHKVLELDFEVLLCSHNPKFQDGKQRLRKKLQFLKDFYGKVSRLYHNGYSISAIIKELKLRRSWQIRILSTGELSTVNMVRSVIRDEQGLRDLS